MIQRVTILDALFFAIPFTAGILYLLAFYPGIMTYDSIFQWDQVSRFDFNNWHPAYHTILLWLLTRVRYTPAVLPLFQILVFSAVTAYGLRAFRDLGVPAALLILVDILFAFIPINGMLQITLWKDVLFGTASLLLTIYLLKIIASRGEWLACGRNWLYFGLVMANVTLLRHNGFPVALGTLLVLLVFYTQRRAALLALVTASLFTGIVLGPVYSLFRVDMNNTQPTGVLLIHPLSAHIHAGAALTAEETAYLNRIRPLEAGWPYNCYDATVLFYQGVDFNPVRENPGPAVRLLARLTLEHPSITLKHFYCLSSFIWQIAQPEEVQLETVYVQNHDINTLPDWLGYAPYINQRSKLPALREMLVQTLDRCAQLDPAKIGWRPAIYLYLFTASVLFFAYRARAPHVLLLLVPILLQSLIIAVSTQLQALRYQYPVYLVALLFAIPLLFLAFRWEKPSSQQDMRA